MCYLFVASLNALTRGTDMLKIIMMTTVFHSPSRVRFLLLALGYTLYFPAIVVLEIYCCIREYYYCIRLVFIIHPIYVHLDLSSIINFLLKFIIIHSI